MQLDGARCVRRTRKRSTVHAVFMARFVALLGPVRTPAAWAVGLALVVTLTEWFSASTIGSAALLVDRQRRTTGDFTVLSYSHPFADIDTVKRVVEGMAFVRAGLFSMWPGKATSGQRSAEALIATLPFEAPEMRQRLADLVFSGKLPSGVDTELPEVAIGIGLANAIGAEVGSVIEVFPNQGDVAPSPAPVRCVVSGILFFGAPSHDPRFVAVDTRLGRRFGIAPVGVMAWVGPEADTVPVVNVLRSQFSPAHDLRQAHELAREAVAPYESKARIVGWIQFALTALAAALPKIVASEAQSRPARLGWRSWATLSLLAALAGILLATVSIMLPGLGVMRGHLIDPIVLPSIASASWMTGLGLLAGWGVVVVVAQWRYERATRRGS